MGDVGGEIWQWRDIGDLGSFKRTAWGVGGGGE